jgi:CheY-like chemotaxis protein
MDLNQEIATVRDLLFNTIAKTITIDLHLSENLASIQADRSQIGQVLMNLGVNARDAMPDGGTLRIETTNIQLDEEYCITHPEAKPESYVLLTVSDTGLGMDKETLSHIFEPFFTTKEQGKGTGLGLATVYGIVKHHEGYINCNSEIDHGTTFNIYLPTIQTDQILETSPIETTIPGGTETILLVEDDGVIRELCAELLTGVGYKVFSAGNGKEALEIYQMEKHKISLILLDLIMPVMDGWQCLAKILRIDPKAKVIIASGYIASGLAKGMQAKGARGFVQKPFETNQLLTTIREVLDKD